MCHLHVLFPLEILDSKATWRHTDSIKDWSRGLFFRQEHILHIKCRQRRFIPQRMFSNNFPWNIRLLRHVPVSYFGRHTGGERFTFLTTREATVQDVRNLWHSAEEGSVGCGGALATWSTLLGTSCLPVLPGFLKEMRILCEIRGFVLILLFVLFFLIIVTNFLF